MSNRDAALRIMRGNRSRELPSSPVGKNSPYTLGVSPTVDEEMAKGKGWNSKVKKPCTWMRIRSKIRSTAKAKTINQFEDIG